MYSFHRQQIFFYGKISVSATSAQLHLMCNLISFRKENQKNKTPRNQNKASPCPKRLTFYEMYFLWQKTRIFNRIVFNATIVFKTLLFANNKVALSLANKTLQCSTRFSWHSCFQALWEKNLKGKNQRSEPTQSFALSTHWISPGTEL